MADKTVGAELAEGPVSPPLPNRSSSSYACHAPRPANRSNLRRNLLWLEWREHGSGHLRRLELTDLHHLRRHECRRPVLARRQLQGPVRDRPHLGHGKRPACRRGRACCRGLPGRRSVLTERGLLRRRASRTPTRPHTSRWPLRRGTHWCSQRRGNADGEAAIPASDRSRSEGRRRRGRRSTCERRRRTQNRSRRRAHRRGGDDGRIRASSCPELGESPMQMIPRWMARIHCMPAGPTARHKRDLNRANPASSRRSRRMRNGRRAGRRSWRWAHHGCRTRRRACRSRRCRTGGSHPSTLLHSPVDEGGKHRWRGGTPRRKRTPPRPHPRRRSRIRNPDGDDTAPRPLPSSEAAGSTLNGDLRSKTTLETSPAAGDESLSQKRLAGVGNPACTQNCCRISSDLLEGEFRWRRPG